ncbi:hypothetical protein Micbo1qcDRAFT_171017 [Microdochium bolleyi]|uniref:Transglycosylase SLT domain-containing protein n=1 Tax=Microdochium bolleyi TaxID=196109 RepID=A0A136JJK1_9PEZI|nr:hypothetical protein Micbo1qcDRAFT_171017 [Microdochium bolleyi]
MVSIKSLFLALAATSAMAAPTPGAPEAAAGTIVDTSPAGNDTGASIMAGPNWYSGPWWNFPGKDTWLSWNELWQRNDDNMVYAGSTWDDVGRLNVAIWNIANEYGIDPRVLLVMVMQESSGYVGVRTTYSWQGIATAGVLQCMNCPGYPGRNNLSQDEINGMIRGGAAHFRADLDQVGGNGWEPSSVYPALRRYNSGVVDHNDLSNGLGATTDYVSDIVQRLGGWTY